MAAIRDLGDDDLQRFRDALFRLGEEMGQALVALGEDLRPVMRWWRSYNTDTTLPPKHGARYHGSRVRR